LFEGEIIKDKVADREGTIRFCFFFCAAEQKQQNAKLLIGKGERKGDKSQVNGILQYTEKNYVFLDLIWEVLSILRFSFLVLCK